MHNHDHSHAAVSFTDTGMTAFRVGIGLNVAFVVIELVAGFVYNSVALLSDAGHNLADVASLLLSFFAFRLARRKATERFTYGYKKTTILAALINGLLLLVAIGVLGYESVNRLTQPQLVVVKGDVIAWVAGAGIVINSVSAFLFYKNKKTDLNLRGAYLHLLADALVSLGVVVGGIVIAFTGWDWLDPLIGLVIMIVILVSTWSLLADSFKMSVDAVPAGIDIGKIREVIRQFDGVTDVFHVHIWPLSTTENALTAHVRLADTLSFEEKIKKIKAIKYELEHHKIQHSTIELEE